MKPSIAIIYDKFLVQGGGERVCEMLVQAFPEATLYALSAKPRAFWEQRLGRRVISPPLGDLFSSRFLVSALYPIAALLMTLIKVKADVVIAYSSSCGKYVRLDCQKSILYSNYPNRGLYQPEKMISSRLIRVLLAPIMALMKPVECRQIYKYDRKLSISDTSRRAMLDFAGIDSEILMPPFNEQAISAVAPSATGDGRDYFVLISRIEPEKELEYVIDAFRMGPRRLKVIGKGSLLTQLRRTSPDNVEFLGYVDDSTLSRELAGARALIFPSEIEYSLVPLEAIFLGTPVISFAAPAMHEILIHVDSGQPDANALFYPEKSANALRGALARFDDIDWDTEAIKNGATRFGRDAFTARIRDIVYGTAAPAP